MFHEIQPTKLVADGYDLFNNQKALLTAKGNEVGTMTIGWGTLGCLWNKPVATVYARPSRHTYTALENSDYFSICCFGKYTKELAYLGTASGHDENKIEKSGLTLIEDLAPYFEEATLVVICKKLYAQPLEPNLFLDEQSLEKFYSGKDEGNFHTTYVGEIVKVLSKN